MRCKPGGQGWVRLRVKPATERRRQPQTDAAGNRPAVPADDRLCRRTTVGANGDGPAHPGRAGGATAGRKQAVGLQTIRPRPRTPDLDRGRTSGRGISDAGEGKRF